jgi:hypothetical protein
MNEEKEARLKLLANHIEAITQQISSDKGDILELTKEKQELLNEYERLNTKQDGTN